MIVRSLIRYFVATGYDRREAVEKVAALRELYGIVGDLADGTMV